MKRAWAPYRATSWHPFEHPKLKKIGRTKATPVADSGTILGKRISAKSRIESEFGTRCASKKGESLSAPLSAPSTATNCGFLRNTTAMPRQGLHGLISRSSVRGQSQAIELEQEAL